MAELPPKTKLPTVGELKSKIDSLKARNSGINFEISNMRDDGSGDAGGLLKEFQQNTDKIKKYNMAIKLGLSKKKPIVSK